MHSPVFDARPHRAHVGRYRRSAVRVVPPALDLRSSSGVS
jgi:hypothetical protein